MTCDCFGVISRKLKKKSISTYNDVLEGDVWHPLPLQIREYGRRSPWKGNLPLPGVNLQTRIAYLCACPCIHFPLSLPIDPQFCTVRPSRITKTSVPVASLLEKLVGSDAHCTYAHTRALPTTIRCILHQHTHACSGFDVCSVNARARILPTQLGQMYAVPRSRQPLCQNIHICRGYVVNTLLRIFRLLFEYLAWRWQCA